MTKALSITGIILTLAVTGFLLRPRAVRAQSGCNVGAVNGAYGFNMKGDYYYTYQGSTYRGVLSGAGAFVFDGNGGLFGADTINDDGNLVRGTLSSGSYSVNSDCRGSMTFTDSNKYSFNFDFVIVSGGREVDFVETDSGNVLTGAAKLQ